MTFLLLLLLLRAQPRRAQPAHQSHPGRFRFPCERQGRQLPGQVYGQVNAFDFLLFIGTSCFLKPLLFSRLAAGNVSYDLSSPSSLSLPVSACTIVSDHSCTQVRAIRCDDVPPSPRCEVHLTRTFSEPGTYCVNISLVDSSSLTRTSTVVTINKSSRDAPGGLLLLLQDTPTCLLSPLPVSLTLSLSLGLGLTFSAEEPQHCCPGPLLHRRAGNGLCLRSLPGVQVSVHQVGDSLEQQQEKHIYILNQVKPSSFKYRFRLCSFTQLTL